MPEDLDGLLVAAGEAPPETRIEWRDPIAAHGDEAVARLSQAEWIGDPEYAAFAIRTIGRAAAFGATTATAALRRAYEFVPSDVLRRDIEAELGKLGVRQVQAKPGARGVRRSATPAPSSVEGLEIGSCYHRRDLQEAGLGGNPRRGISYPAGGTHCLLFSDPSKDSDWGYRDRPDGNDRYLYFGAWDGPGDMSLTGGNAVVLERSPELYLFTAAPCGMMFRGQFECLGWSVETVENEGRSRRAIVFTLQRVT
jgi:hypothetical protein